MTIGNHQFLPGEAHDHQNVRWSALCTPDNFTIFEATSEIERMIIGRAVTSLPSGASDLAEQGRAAGDLTRVNS
jgi:hypothetical protein